MHASQFANFNVTNKVAKQISLMKMCDNTTRRLVWHDVPFQEYDNSRRLQGPFTSKYFELCSWLQPREGVRGGGYFVKLIESKVL